MASVTGTIQNPDTTATANCYARFWLRGTNGSQPRVNGTALIAPGQGANYFQDYTANSSGVFSGTCYGNDVIEVAGAVGQHPTWWGVQVFTNGLGGPETPFTFNDASSFNMNSATPITTIPVTAAPTGDTTYARLDGGNMPFTGQVVGKAGTVGSPSFVLNGSLTTGFWRQAADVIGVSIAGVLKWLENAAGYLFGSGGAIGWSSNTDPSAAGGDLFINRQSANTLGIGTTSAGKDGTLNAAKAVISTTAAGSGGSAAVSQVIAATAPGLSFEATGGGADQKWWDILPHSTDFNIRAVNDANSSAGTALTINRGALATIGAITFGAGGGVQTLPTATDTLVGKATTDTLTNKTLTGVGSGNAVTLLNQQGPIGALTGNSADQTVYSYQIPANTIGAGKGFRIRTAWIHNSGTAAVSYKLIIGSTTLGNPSDTGAGVSTWGTDVFNNSGVQNAQWFITLPQSDAGNWNSGNVGTATENFANAITVKLTFNVANTDQVTGKGWYVEIVQ